MADAVDDDLYRRAQRLLEPGEIELEGSIVHTDLAGEEDLEMHELTVAINDVIAEFADKGESYIYAGNDSEEFASNQFQGKTVADDEFVWECQQLLREGTFDLVFYYEAGVEQSSLADELEALDNVAGVTTVP